MVVPAWCRQDFPIGVHPVEGEATALQSLTDYASPAKRFFFTMACTPQLPSTTCVMP